ncbi:MAG TPA: carbamoyltransferase C-terminal domain-containing protein [Victivallales bacterium]|nr:carbamoyltransferase C-terminal domain-containing protein [Victivallales bacterium]
MNILGITAFVHDSAACLVQNGKLIINIEEERLNREKHTNCFPEKSIKKILQSTGLKPNDIDLIAFNWQPWRLLNHELRFAIKYLPFYLKILKLNKPPINFRSIAKIYILKKYINKTFNVKFNTKIEYVPHHLAHAASAYYLSPYNDSDIMVFDGYGENSATSAFTAFNTRITKKWSLPVENSIGVVYRNFTKYLGFREFQEGTLMALASYGENEYKDFFEKCFILKKDGKFKVNRQILGYWSYKNGYVYRHLGAPRSYDEPISLKHKNIAHSLQYGIKKALLHALEYNSKKNKNKNLCLAGGCFLNCDVNSDIVNSGIYENVFIPPFTSDTGGAIGAALYAAFNTRRERRKPPTYFSPYLGTEYSNEDIKKTIDLCIKTFIKTDNINTVTAHALLDGKILGWFQGKMESGPRALGNRSILASPFELRIKDRINNNIKKRETFRPFAPIVTPEAAKKYFEIKEPFSKLALYMLLTVKIKKEYYHKFPAVSHVDNTARIQIVTEETNKKLYDLLIEFEHITGYAVLLNTSFNVREPIVCTPQDAVDTYLKTELDGLIIGDYYTFK